MKKILGILRRKAIWRFLLELWLALQLSCFFSGVRGAISAETKTLRPGWEEYRQALTLIRAGKNQEALPLMEQALRQLPDNMNLKADYLCCLVWAGLYRRAVDYYNRYEKDLQNIKYLPRNIAKAFYEERDFRQAQKLYALAWSYDKKDTEAFKGLIYASCRQRDFLAAYQAWNRAQKEKLISGETVDYMAVWILAQLGGSNQAQAWAREKGVKDPELLTTLTGDSAVAHLRWEEVQLALQILESQLQQNPQNYRARMDYLVALRQKEHMQEVVAQFELLQKAPRPIPYWVIEAAADAYLYLKQPEKAIHLYKQVLAGQPKEPFNPLMGLYHCYVELRQWDQAGAILQQLEELLAERKQTSKKRKWGPLGKKKFIEERQSLIDTQGWFLAYQDKLSQAQDHFEGAVKQAGLNVGFRSGLAHTYLWRQWPSRALTEFLIIDTLEPFNKGALVGKALTLNTLNRKNESRALARQLYSRYPRDRHVQDLMETLRVEDAFSVSPTVYFTKEFKGATEYYVVGSLEEPLTTTFKVYSQIIRQYIASELSPGVEEEVSWDRLLFGFDWLLHPAFSWKQAVTFDYLRGRDFGFYTKVRWWPSDPVTLEGEFDSFSLNVPIRARATGMRAKSGALAVRYIGSDLWEGGLIFVLNRFSDNNFNPSFTWRLKRQVFNHPEVKLWLAGEFNYLRYTDQEVDYFSPLYSYSILFTPTVHWLHYHRYNTKWRSSFYPRGGLVKEHKTVPFAVAGITYEQLLELSQSFSLNWNVSYDLRVYTGEYTHVLGTFFTFRKAF